MRAERESAHEWLMNLVGNWTSETTCDMPGGISTTSKGTEVVRAIGDVWIVGEGTIPMAEGDPMTSIMTLGFDPMKDRFVGTWIGSPMAQLVVYEGTRHGHRLTLDCEAPGLEDPTKLVAYQDIVEFRGSNERALLSQKKSADGRWTQFMEVVYRRVR